jgi:hypothetical protein
MQTKTQSLIESFINILIGYGVAVTSQIIIFPLFNVNIPLSANFQIGIYFTIISLIRSYLLRRYFNWSHGREYLRRYYAESERTNYDNNSRGI